VACLSSRRAAEAKRYVSMSTARTITAFLVAPLMTPIVLLGADQLHGAPFNLSEQVGAFVFVSGFAYAATALFGIPSFLLFRANRWNNVLLYILFGGIIGLLVSIILNYPVFFDGLSLEYPGLHAGAGALSALVFRVLSGANFDHVSRAPAHGET
jgi:hypothetical protein